MIRRHRLRFGIRSHLLRIVALPLLLTACSLARSAPAPGVPEPFAPGLVPSAEIVAFSGFSPRGTEFYYSEFQPGRVHSVLMLSRHTPEGWSRPEVLPFSGGGSDQEPFMSPDGRFLYFTSTRQNVDRRKLNLDIWRVERQPSGQWGEPRRLVEISTETFEASPVVTRSGTLYFTSGRPGGFGGMDVYRSRSVAGRHTEVENLGPTINTAGDESSVYVTPDERLMLLAVARRRRGGGARHDLYVSVRRRGAWTEPRPLEGPINTEADELSPRLSPDGKYLYFSRDFVRRLMDHPEARMGVYRVPARPVLRRALR